MSVSWSAYIPLQMCVLIFLALEFTLMSYTFMFDENLSNRI